MNKALDVHFLAKVSLREGFKKVSLSVSRSTLLLPLCCKSMSECSSIVGELRDTHPPPWSYRSLPEDSLREKN